MTLNALAIQAHLIAREKGWYNGKTRNIGELIALMHSELSEALEHSRKLRPGELRKIFYTSDLYGGYKTRPTGSYVKPDGFAVELADCLIRILDASEHLKIDIDKAVKVKMEYNRGRPIRHGGKKF